MPSGLTIPFQPYHILCYFRILLQETDYSLLPEQAVHCHISVFIYAVFLPTLPLLCQAKILLTFPGSDDNCMEFRHFFPFLPYEMHFQSLLFIQLGVMFRMYYIAAFFFFFNLPPGLNCKHLEGG